MAQPIQYLVGTACVLTLILACVCAGCTSSQNSSQGQVATQAPQSGTNTITIENFAFNPATLTVAPGTSVTWTNRDGVTHTITADSGSPAQFTSEQLANGSSFSFPFIKPGTYTYHCSIHPSMKGTVVVQS